MANKQRKNRHYMTAHNGKSASLQNIIRHNQWDISGCFYPMGHLPQTRFSGRFLAQCKEQLSWRQLQQYSNSTMTTRRSQYYLQYLVGVSLNALPIVPSWQTFECIYSPVSNASHLVRHLGRVAVNDCFHCTSNLNCSNPGALNPFIPMSCW